MKCKAAILDLYNNEYNEGIRCLKEILTETGLQYDLFDTRYKDEIPGTEYDIYISSGGPGSPFDGEGTKWEKDYFNLLDKIIDHNERSEKKKYLFFICHSFQVMARYFRFAEVTERYSKSFGVLPFIKTEEGSEDLLLKELPQPFYGADFRDYQVINADEKRLKELGASVLSIEIPFFDHPQALMGVRISPEIAGTQFHPEADARSMNYHFQKPDRIEYIKNKFGEDMYYEMIRALDKPHGIKLTRQIVLPSFLNSAIKDLENYDKRNQKKNKLQL